MTIMVVMVPMVMAVWPFRIVTVVVRKHIEYG
jgi:hypothetical protein